jgi:predicted ATPase
MGAQFPALIAEAHGRAGRPLASLELLAEALDRVEATGGRWFEAELHRLRGELLLAGSGDADAAEVCFGCAIEVARQQGARMWELRASTSLARLWQEQGRCAEAHGSLARVYDWFSEGFELPDLTEAKRLLERVAAPSL